MRRRQRSASSGIPCFRRPKRGFWWGVAADRQVDFRLVLLAEFEVWHSRPITPTRRLSLGHMFLPVDPLPGFGGLLLAAILAANLEGFDEELLPDLHRLLNQAEAGQRVVQPRLRHRFQVDHVGLAHTVHRLSGDGENISFELAETSSPMPQALAVVYAIERFDDAGRRSLAGLLRRAMHWQGPIGPSFIAHLAGVGASVGPSFIAFADPKAWALDVLGFPVGTVMPAKKEVTALYRQRLREVHPDHGGAGDDASKLIIDITEARRILTS